MPRQDQEELESQYGVAAARLHWDLNQAALAEMKQRIRKHAIDCDWKQGIVTVCRRQKQESWYRQYADKLKNQYQADFIDYLSADAMSQLLDSPACHGGLIDRGSGHPAQPEWCEETA